MHRVDCDFDVGPFLLRFEYLPTVVIASLRLVITAVMAGETRSITAHININMIGRNVRTDGRAK